MPIAPEKTGQSRTAKAGILGFGKLLIKFTGVVSAAVLARMLTKTDYAAYRQTLLAYHFVEPFFLLGLTQSLLYFIPRDRANARKMLSGNLLMLFSMGFVFALATWLGGNGLLARRFSNPSLSGLLLIYSPYAMLALPIGTIGSCLVACNRVKTLTVYNVASQVISLACVLVLVFAFRTVEAAIIGVVVGGVIVFFPGIVLMYRSVPPGGWLPSLPGMWEQLKFGVPLGLAGMIGLFNINIDKMLVSSLCSPEDFAVYVNGAVEIPFVGIITGSVMAVLIPEIAVLFKAGDRGGIVELWKRATVKCALLILPLMAFSFVMSGEIMTVLFSAKYAGSSLPFRVYLLLLPVRVTQFGAILMAGGKSSWILWRTIVSSVLNIVLSYALIKQIGYIGASIGTVIVIYVWAVPFSLFGIAYLCREKVRRLIPWAEVGKIAALAVVPGAACWLLKITYGAAAGPLAGLVAAGVLYSALLLALYLRFRVINPDDLKKMRLGALKAIS